MVLANLGENNYIVNKGHGIAKLIIEKILDDRGSLQEVDQLQPTMREIREFGSIGLAQINKQPRTSARLLSQTKEEKSQLQPDRIIKQVRTGANLLNQSARKGTSLRAKAPYPGTAKPPGWLHKQVHTGARLLSKHAEPSNPKGASIDYWYKKDRYSRDISKGLWEIPPRVR